MTTTTDERNRILHLIEADQITAAQAGQLLDALVAESEHSGERVRNRVVRVWMSDLSTRQKRMNVTATLPVSLIRGSLHMLAHLMPQFNESLAQDVLRSVESGATGRLLDIQDLEEGKRIEVFVE